MYHPKLLDCCATKQVQTIADIEAQAKGPVSTDCTACNLCVCVCNRETSIYVIAAEEPSVINVVEKGSQWRVVERESAQCVETRGALGSVFRRRESLARSTLAANKLRREYLLPCTARIVNFIHCRCAGCAHLL